ncbi:uncharacterized protein DNG_04735 [Cephalotrichum gorgonifer]|uniref:Uncharacterized protein n=1 Tax=Cephalotrichum gorgonifer TaxID=2041049 RepID=A0AAE8MWZ7_9PEZI|nr:uncharacterized protein DNG_04735 [Cephalotrichum gorgonifer]
MFLPPHYPTRFLTANQDANDPDSPDTQTTDLPDSATHPVVPDNDGHASGNNAPLRVLKKRPSFSHVLGRVRSISGSSTSSNGQKSSAINRPAKSVQLASSLPANSWIADPQSTDARHRRDPAPWDRTVDFVYHKYPNGTTGPDKSLDFERSVNLFLAEHGRQRTPALRGYTTLPAVVRFKIWEYIFNTDTDDKPVALTMAYWNKDAWREDEFASLCEAMKTTRPYLEISFELRADALVAFLMTRRFHVTFSPCIRPLLNPLATQWLEKYGPYMQDIALEVVLTEFRFGMSPSAQILSPATSYLEKLICDFVQVLRSKATEVSFSKC